MRLLLDTHSYAWTMFDPRRLSAPAAAAIGNPSNELFLSIASIWEATIKISSGKANAPSKSLAEFLKPAAPFAVETLAISESHLRILETLPWRHRDPFDRLLIAQAQAEGMVLVTHDSQIARYNVNCLW